VVFVSQSLTLCASGDDCRVLRSYPGKWQVHVVDAEGNAPCIAIEVRRLNHPHTFYYHIPVYTHTSSLSPYPLRTGSGLEVAAAARVLLKSRGTQRLVRSAVCVSISTWQDSKPSYARLQEVLATVPGSKSSQTWDERLRSEFQFNNDSLK
jgi:hypothetical protein